MRIKMKINLVNVQIIRLEVFSVKIIGRIRAISTSKIRKIIAIKKNRIEKGRREEFIGVNPHSNGDSFSRSEIFFFLRIEDKIITINATIKIIRDIISKFRIIYIKFF
jgi:hypothetical protein